MCATLCFLLHSFISPSACVWFTGSIQRERECVVCKCCKGSRLLFEQTAFFVLWLGTNNPSDGIICLPLCRILCALDNKCVSVCSVCARVCLTCKSHMQCLWTSLISGYSDSLMGVTLHIFLHMVLHVLLLLLHIIYTIFQFLLLLLLSPSCSLLLLAAQAS